MKSNNLIAKCIIALICIGSVACSTSKTTSVSEVGDYKSLAAEKLGEQAKFEHSPDDTFVLCYKNDEGTAKKPQNLITYFVYDLKKNELIHEDVFGPGSIKWFDGNKLEIFIMPGIMPESKTREDFIYILNVETKNRSSKVNYGKQ